MLCTLFSLRLSNQMAVILGNDIALVFRTGLDFLGIPCAHLNSLWRIFLYDPATILPSALLCDVVIEVVDRSLEKTATTAFETVLGMRDTVVRSLPIGAGYLDNEIF